jgi:hypothetical protein
MHGLMLTKMTADEIGPDVPVHGYFRLCAKTILQATYLRSMFLAMKNTFAGRSPSRRMK